MKDIKEVESSFNFKAHAAYISGIVFDLEYFKTNGTKIINDFNCYGSCILWNTKTNKTYGLLFKDTSGDDNDLYLKCYLYRWPQYGILHGGKTFWCGTKEISTAVLQAMNDVT